MLVSEYKKCLKLKRDPIIPLYSLECLKLLPADKRRKTHAADSRSFIQDGFWQVYPIGVDQYHVYIVCPHCGEIHLHGRTADGYEGHRVSHCKSGSNNGYWILKAPVPELKTIDMAELLKMSDSELAALSEKGR